MIKIRMILISVICSLTIAMSCDVLSSALSLVNCKYEIAGLSTPSIAGISLNNVQNINNLNPVSLLKVSSAIMAGNLPLSVTVNVNATNPNNTIAQIEGLEWAVDLENKTMFTGMVANRVTVPANGGQTIIPLSIQVDLMDILKGESKDNILSFVQGVLNVGESSSKVSFRVKPSIMIGGQKLSTGFITLSKNVGK